MKIFVTGVGGQLGHDVIERLVSRDIECIGSDIQKTWGDGVSDEIKKNVCYVPLDITDKALVSSTITALNPDAVIHCAAWTTVDAAEEEKNKLKVESINVDGTKNIAHVCKQINAKMMYISTDYVFNGCGDTPWKPDCKDYAPLNFYGKTKLDGELAVSSMLDNYFIVRIAWVFGINGNNFIKTMVNLSKSHKELKIVDDQIGSPTFTYDLARLLCDMIITEKYGYYHATNEGDYISWADFATEVFKQIGADVKIHRVSTKEYGQSLAARPYNSRLDKTKLVECGFKPLPDWKDAVKRYLISAGFINS